MKQYKLIQVALLAILLFGWAGCSQIEEEVPGNARNGIVLNVTDTGLISNEPSTRTEDAGFVTTFTQGDQIGLFAVKDGTILDEINNMPFTFNGSSWSGKPILYDDRLAGVTFYAYYPYQPDMSDKTDLAGDDFFAPLVAGWELTTEQSDQKAYAKQDLMTSNATALIGENGNYSLSFQLTHRMSLVVVKLPSTRYIFTDAEGVAMPEETPYVAMPVDVAFYLDNVGEGNKIAPYYDAKQDEYRLLRKPSSENQIIGHYNDKQCTLDTTEKMKEGKYKRFVVDGGYKEVTHHLQVGDLYYADGSVISVEEETPSSKNCIGVVYYVGNPQPSARYGDVSNYKITPEMDILKQEYPNCCHGLVLALGTDVADSWGDATVFMHEWFLTFDAKSHFTSLSGYYFDNAKDNAKNIETRFGLGYNNVRVIEEYVKLNIDKSDSYVVLQQIREYQNKYDTPSTSTKWYLPSIGDFNGLIATSTNNLFPLLNRQIEKVGGIGLQSNKEYWTSTERRKELTYYAIYNGSRFETNKTKNKTTEYLYRFGLAF